MADNNQIPLVQAIANMSDIEVLSAWTVAELDDLHFVLGNGEAWIRSHRRECLVMIENGEIENLDRIKNEVHL